MTDLNDALAAAAAALDAPAADNFKFEKEGDQVAGIVTGVSIGSTAYGAYPLLNLLTEDGPVIVRGLASVLKDLVGCLIGDAVAIRYDGVGGKNGKTKLYKVVVIRDGVQITLPRVTPDELDARKTAGFASSAGAAFDDGEEPF